MDCMIIKETINKIVKQANLNSYEADMLLHDINNLRGNEWLDVVEKHCSKRVISTFKKIIKTIE